MKDLKDLISDLSLLKLQEEVLLKNYLALSLSYSNVGDPYLSSPNINMMSRNFKFLLDCAGLEGIKIIRPFYKLEDKPLCAPVANYYLNLRKLYV